MLKIDEVPEGLELCSFPPLDMQMLHNPETGNFNTADGVIYWKPEVDRLLKADVEINKQIHMVKKVFGRFGQFLGGAEITEVKKIEETDSAAVDGGSSSETGEAERERSQGTLF